MSVEYLLVSFPEDRDVLADGDRVGVTDHTILITANEQDLLEWGRLFTQDRSGGRGHVDHATVGCRVYSCGCWEVAAPVVALVACQSLPDYPPQPTSSAGRGKPPLPRPDAADPSAPLIPMAFSGRGSRAAALGRVNSTDFRGPPPTPYGAAGW